MKFIKIILFIIPFIWSVLLVPFVNKIEPFIFGLPFLAFWETMGIFIASICIGLTYHIDLKNEELNEKHK